jgi:hypothetical protein
MNEATKNILTNPEIIAINQDKLGEQARLVSTKGKMWVYLKNMEGGKKAVAVLNTSGKEKTFELSTKMLDMEGIWKAYDVWQHKEAGLLSRSSSMRGYMGELIFPGDLSLTVKPHETVVLVLEKREYQQKY